MDLGAKASISLGLILLGAAGCGTRETVHAHGGRQPATALVLIGNLTHDEELHFFAHFDGPSFTGMAELAFTHPEPGVRFRAEWLMNDVLWNWYPDLPSLKERRHKAREILLGIARHPDPRVRAGVLKAAKMLYTDPSQENPVSGAIRYGLEDPDADVRLAAIRLAIVFHTGHVGGCVIEPKQTAFTLKTHQALLENRLLAESDARVRADIFFALTCCPGASTSRVIHEYFAAADRRPEVAALAHHVWVLFGRSGAMALNMDEAVWKDLCDFSSGLEASGPVGRRNAISILLEVAIEAGHVLGEDAGMLGRVISWLETDEHIGEEDMRRVLRHWAVMETDRIIHRPNSFLGQSTLAEFLDGLRSRLSLLRDGSDSREKGE